MRSISELELSLVAGGYWEQDDDGSWYDDDQVPQQEGQTGDRPAGLTPMDGGALGGIIGGAAGLGSVLAGGAGVAGAGDVIATATIVGGVIGLTAAVIGVGIVAGYTYYSRDERSNDHN
jgi:hypothetical protein